MDIQVKIDVKREPIQVVADYLKSGNYYLPTFQKQYVWDEDDIKDFIDSIIRNLPIGSIILWKPSVGSAKRIDPFSKPFLDIGGRNNKEILYIIDGQQRLTSLMLLLNNWKIKRGGEIIERHPISYNPSNRKFQKSSTRGIDLSKLIKAFYEYDDAAISELKKGSPNEAYKEMQNMIKGILKYPVPLCILETEKEDEKNIPCNGRGFYKSK